MNESASAAEGSSLLWLLGATIAVLAVHVALGWARQAQRRPGLRQQWPALLLAAGALGSGWWAAALLCVQSAALPFPIGFDAVQAAALWLLAVLAAWPVLRGQALRRRPWWVHAGGAALLALLLLGLQAGWGHAAGLQPGLLWRSDVVAATLVLAALGLGLGLWAAAQAGAARAGAAGADADAAVPARRSVGLHARAWRVGGALLAGLSFVVGFELLMLFSGLLDQSSVVPGAAVSGAVLSAVCGAVLPLVLAGMAADLALRDQQRTSRPRGFTPRPRRDRSRQGEHRRRDP